MKLRTRLIISFCLIIFVPVLLAVATVWGFGQYQMKTVRQIYNVDGSAYDYFINSFKVLSHFTKRIMKNYRRLLKKHRRSWRIQPIWMKLTLNWKRNIPI